MASDHEEKNLASLIADVFQKRNWQRRLGLHQVFLFWDKVIGAEIAAHAQPKVIRGDVLWLAVSDSVWIQHLQFEKMTILDKINARLAKMQPPNQADNQQNWRLNDIRFDIVNKSKAYDLLAEKSKKIEKKSTTINQARLAEFDRLLEAVSEPKLKNSMRRLWLAMEGR